MKVLALNGSRSPEGITWNAIKLVGEELQKENIGLNIVHIGAKPIAGCLACHKCHNNGHLCIQDDIVNELIEMLPNYDGLILACPVQYMGIPGPFKACLDRLLYATEHLEGWGPKPAAAIVVCSKNEAGNTAQQLGNYLNCSNLITVNGQSSSVIFGSDPNQFLELDKAGVKSMQMIGRNMAWLLKIIAASKDTVPAPQYSKRMRVNFCRKV